MEFITLNNGIKMPKLGYGVYQTPADITERCVSEAIEIGYRSVDTAQIYGNEEGVGSAIAKCGIPREEFFITTKIWISNSGYEKAKTSIDQSLKKLKTDFIDLMLIHQPFGDYYGSYRAMEEAYKEKKIRAIGVSNFYPDRLIDLCTFCEIVPAVNQIETHVFSQQQTAREIMAKYGVCHESWGPFVEGYNDFFKNEILLKIGKKYNKSVAQIALRYLMQMDIIVIPKSVHKERMIENFDVFNFVLSKEDMEKIKELDQHKNMLFLHQDVKTVEWFMNRSKEYSATFQKD